MLHSDITFLSDNEYGIPVLLPELQATSVIHPVKNWGDQPRSVAMSGTYAFYTWDYKFRALWKKPYDLVVSRCPQVIEPNFSIEAQQPKAWVLWQTFQKRWLARFWQAHGIRVFVDVNVPPPYTDVNFLGVPTGWTAYACRVHRYMWMSLEERFEMVCTHANTSRVLFVVYGGNRKVGELCQQQQWIWIPDTRSQQLRGKA